LLQLGDEEVNKESTLSARSIICLRTRRALEVHLSQRCGELFAVQNEVFAVRHHEHLL